jgi:hypothetical protein
MKKITMALVLLFAVYGISRPQSLTLTSPNGGESWALGSPQTITWTHSGFTGNVTILLMKEGVRVGVIQDGVPVVSGHIDWIAGQYIGGTAVAGTGYKIRIKRVGSDLIDNSNQPFTLTGLTAREPTPTTARPMLTVTSPNGGETWLLRALRSNAATVTWTSLDVSGSITVILKKGGNPVRTQTLSSGASCSFSYDGVATGDDYRIRVENGDGSVWDESDGNFSIKREMLTPMEPKTVSLVPSVLNFQLNNGAETTETSSVTMDHVAHGNPTHYRWRTEVQPDWGTWVPYVDGHPVGQIPNSGTEHTIYFQIKNTNGESAPVSDSIRYGEIERAYGPGLLNICPCPSPYACSPGWKWSVIEQSFPQNIVRDQTQVGCADRHGDCYWEVVIEAKTLTYMKVSYGTKTEFEFFAGRQLNEGWSFVRLEYEGQEGEGKGYRITRMPQPGSRDITFRVRVWVDAGYGTCTFKIKRIIVKGPANIGVNGAF